MGKHLVVNRGASRGRFSIWLAAALLAVGGPCPAAETSAKTPRLTVAVLTFEDGSGDVETAHWRRAWEAWENLSQPRRLPARP